MGQYSIYINPPLWMALIALVMAAMLAAASKIFYVETDPRVASRGHEEVGECPARS